MDGHLNGGMYGCWGGALLNGEFACSVEWFGLFKQLAEAFKRRLQFHTSHQSKDFSGFQIELSPIPMDPKPYQAVVSKNDRFFDHLSSNGSYNLLQVTCGHKNSILHIAARTGQVRKAEKIISVCPSLLLKPNSRGDSPLNLAARLGHLEMAQLLINRAKLVEVETSKELLRMENQKKDTALHDAVRNGHVKVVSLLIEEDSELTRAVNSDGESPIFVAVDRRFYDIARYILELAPMCPFLGRFGMNVPRAAVIRAETSKS